MQALALVYVLQFILLIISYIQYLFPSDKDGRVVAFVLVGMALALPYVYTVYVMIKWFRYDGPETRVMLPKALLVSFFVQLLRGLWAIFGSLIIFGDLLPAYLVEHFPDYFEERLAKTDVETLSHLLRHQFLWTTILYMVITLPLTFYFMGVSKRLKPYWQPMSLKAGSSLE